MYRSVENELTWNVVKGGIMQGFQLFRSSNNILSNNSVTGFRNDVHTRYGFYLLLYCESNDLAENRVIIDGGWEYDLHGFYLEGRGTSFQGTVVRKNTVEMYDVHSAARWFGFTLYSASDVVIRENTVTVYEDRIYYTQVYGYNVDYGHGIDIVHNVVENALVGFSFLSVKFTATDNIARNNYFGFSLIYSNENTIARNSISNSEIGIELRNCFSNTIYHNNLIDNVQQVEIIDSDNYWYNPDLLEGNFWSNYWGQDDGSNGRVAGDGVGDTNLPHEGVDPYPLMYPTAYIFYRPILIIWRGGWSPVEIQAVDPLGNIVSRDGNQIGPYAWYIEDDQSIPDSTLVMIIIAIPTLESVAEQIYSFQMTALADLTYSMDWFVINTGEVLFERSVEDVPLEAGQTKLVETALEITPEGEIVVEAAAQYDFGGILQPVNADGTSVFEQGSTVPVKFQLFDEDGNPDGTAFAFLELAMVIDGVVGDFMPADSTSAADIANVFRYDEEEAQYIFNLNTAELDVGIYILRITLDDGQQFTVQIGIM
jgi:parallel beta-helix repeat protein